MSEGPSEAAKDDASRTAESFATWLSLFGVSPSGTPVPSKPKPTTPKKRSRTDRAPADGEDSGRRA
jgi:hypothetical protein